LIFSKNLELISIADILLWYLHKNRTYKITDIVNVIY
jgi:hypothetical protein